MKVGVIDDGVDADHEDLAQNYDKRIDQPDNIGTGSLPNPENDSDSDESNNHGTSVAGTIAAARNGIGTVGVAYEATIASYKYANSVTSLQSTVNFDVSSNSWGGSSHFQDDTSFKEFPHNLEKQALENAVTNGRDGLGTVFTWAGGNERDNVNNNLPSDGL